MNLLFKSSWFFCSYKLILVIRLRLLDFSIHPFVILISFLILEFSNSISGYYILLLNIWWPCYENGLTWYKAINILSLLLPIYNTRALNFNRTSRQKAKLCVVKVGETNIPPRENVTYSKETQTIVVESAEKEGKCCTADLNALIYYISYV